MLHSGTPASITPSYPEHHDEDGSNGILSGLGTVRDSGSDEGRCVAQTTAEQHSRDSNADVHPETSTVRRNRSKQGTDQRGIPTLLDIEVLAKSLGISMRQVRRFVAEGQIPFIRIGHLIRFDPKEINKWIEGRRCGTQSKA